MPDSEWVDLITEYIDKNFTEKLTLESLADICHGSPYHMHRTFKKLKALRWLSIYNKLEYTRLKSI